MPIEVLHHEAFTATTTITSPVSLLSTDVYCIVYGAGGGFPYASVQYANSLGYGVGSTSSYTNSFAGAYVNNFTTSVNGKTSLTVTVGGGTLLYGHIWILRGARCTAAQVVVSGACFGTGAGGADYGAEWHPGDCDDIPGKEYQSLTYGLGGVVPDTAPYSCFVALAGTRSLTCVGSNDFPPTVSGPISATGDPNIAASAQLSAGANCAVTVAPGGVKCSPRVAFVVAYAITDGLTGTGWSDADYFGGGNIGNGSPGTNNPAQRWSNDKTIASAEPDIAVAWGNGAPVDLTALVSARARHAIVAPEQSISGGSGVVDQCTVTIHGESLNSESYQSPITIDIQRPTYDPVRLFTGYVRSMSEVQKAPGQGHIATLDCRSRDDVLLQLRMNSTAAQLDDSAEGHVEDWHIIRWLEMAGLVDGTDFRSYEYAAAHSTTATIDYGLFPIGYTWLDDESPLTDLWRIAGACLGWFYCDPDGVFRYRNAAGLLDELVTAQFGAGDVLELDETNTSGLTISFEDRELYSSIAVQYATRTPGETEVLWEPEQTPVVPAGQTVTLWAELSYPAVELGISDWSAHNAGGTALAGVSAVVTAYSQRVKLVFTNAATQQAYIYGLHVSGRPLRNDQTEQVVKESTAAFWTGSPARVGRARRVTGNDYIQSYAHADAVASYLLARQEVPRKVLRLTGVDNPHVRPGMRVNVDGYIITDGPLPCVVTETNWQLSANGFALDCKCMDLTDLFNYDAYFVIGTNTLGEGATGDHAPIFY